MNKKISITVIWITIITVISKILGFFRDVMIASRFGTSSITDAFVMSQSIINIFTGILLAGLTITLIPLLTELKLKSEFRKYNRFINNVLSFSVLLTSLLSLILITFSDEIVIFFAPGFDEHARLLTIRFLYLMVPTVILGTLVLINNSILNVEEKYNIPAMIGYPVNGIMIFVLIFAPDSYSVDSLGASVTIGTIIQIVLQLFYLKKQSIKFSFVIDYKDPILSKMLILMVPTTLGSALSLINNSVDRMLGSMLLTGSVAALNFSNRLSMFVLGLVSASVTTVFYSFMSKFSSNSDLHAFKTMLTSTVNYLIIIIIPASVGFVVLRNPIIRLIYARGTFDESSIAITSQCLMYFAIGLIAYSIRDVLTRSFYSLQDTMTPMINGGIAVALNIILNIYLSKFMGVGGLALATSISGITSVVLLFISLQRKVGDIGLICIGNCLFKALLSSFIMGIGVNYSYLIMDALPLTFQVLLSIVIGVILYIFVAILLKTNEIITLVNGLQKALNNLNRKVL